MAKVLLVEDNLGLAKNWSYLLESSGHKVFSAENGVEGLEALSNDPDIIFCDHGMPIMDGYEFCRIVKTDSKYKSHSNIPIVSVGSFPENKREYLARFLEKPLYATDLLKAIEDFIK
jgi:twitching motility two-component system response regulator PilG